MQIHTQWYYKAREIQISQEERRFSRIEFVQMKMVSCHRGQFMLMVEVWNAWNGDPIMIGALCTTLLEQTNCKQDILEIQLNTNTNTITNTNTHMNGDPIMIGALCTTSTNKL